MSLDLLQLRNVARKYGLQEIYFNDPSKLISFTDGITRFNIYYTTGTVGTCLNHPFKGKTQLFRRNQSMAAIDVIFGNPRAHTGDGYYRVMQSGGWTGTGTIAGNDMRNDVSFNRSEEDSLKLQLQLISNQENQLRDERKNVEEALLVFEMQRKREAARVAEANRIAEEERERVRKETIRQAEVAAAREAAQVENARIDARGRFMAGITVHSDFWDSLTRSVSCLAMGSTAILTLYDDNSFAWTGGLPTVLRNKLNGRQKSLPPPVYVAMGPNSEYYVRFRDNVLIWSNNDEDGAMDRYIRANSVDKVFFGPQYAWLVLTTDGRYYSNNVHENVLAMLNTKKNNRRTISCLSLAAHGQYFVSFTDGFFEYLIHDGDITKEIRSMDRAHSVKHVYLSNGEEDITNYLIRYT